MSPKANRPVAARWNRGWNAFILWEWRRRHSGDHNRLRAAFGLPATRATPLFETAVPPVARLDLWPATFAPIPQDVTENLRCTGFPYWSDPAPMPAVLQRFLQAGPAPLVITLGSVGQSLGAKDFYARAMRRAREVNLRIVTLSGATHVLAEGHDVCMVPYAPHTRLFQHAQIVLHHGGIGTTAQALRAGVPQLIYPLGADQPDTAAHVVRLGLGQRLPWRLGRASRKAMNAVLTPKVAQAARRFAQHLSTNGAEKAATDLMKLSTQHGGFYGSV